MSDPQDLLYTNQFISTEILSDKSISKNVEYYSRFQNYIENNVQDDTKKYIDSDEYETSDVNIKKILNKPWPLNGNKNHYPLFDTYISDISTNRYKKEIITKINIDSRNRDIAKYSNINNFEINLPRVFSNITKYIINDLMFINTNQSLDNYGNSLAWQYVSQNYLITNNIDTTIIPSPSLKNISYSKLPNSAFAYTAQSNSTSDVDNYLVYQTYVPPGFYTIENLITDIKYNTSLILHGQNATQEVKIVEEPYIAYTKRIGTPHLFSCSINPISSVVRFVNRIEEVKICAIQTFSPYENNFIANDIFYTFSSENTSSTNYSLDTSLIYILIPQISDVTSQYYYNVNCIYTPNAFPLVITDLNFNIGNINYDLINYTEFFDLKIYTSNDYTESELDSISHYKFIDTITITSTSNVTFSETYIRLGLRLSNGNLNGNLHNLGGKVINPSITENIVMEQSLNNFLNNYNSNSFYISTTAANTFYTKGIINNFNYIDINPLVGRALLYRWIFDKKGDSYINYEFETNNEKKRSLLHILAWPIANETFDKYTIETNNGYKFVHTNYNSYVLNKNSLRLFTNFTNRNNQPILRLNLQYFSNNYYFYSNSYIFLKINLNPVNNSHSQYLNALSLENIQYNQNYVDGKFMNVGIGEDFTSSSFCSVIEVYKKDPTNIYTKILLSDVPGNYSIQTSNIINNNSYYVNYDSVNDNITSISVEIYDPTLKIISRPNDFSFTLEMHEVHDILKETLINTKTNNISTTGSFI